MSMSLDGFLARPDHSLDWYLDRPGQDDRRHAETLAFLSRMDAIVLGRRAATDMAPAWSTSDSPMARRINALPKLIFARTPIELDWDNARVTDGPVEEAAALEGDVVCFGGAQFAHALAAADLIDEYRLTIHPVALGAGLPLWHGLPEPQRFALASSTVYADGSVVQALARSR